MRLRIIFTLLLLFLAVFSVGDNGSVSAENEQNRVRFQITTIGETANNRKILSQTTIEGVPGTDFNINLQTGNFKMQARFLSDLISADQLKIRAKLNTRRFYGYSPMNLPLYEEDSQNQTLQIGFDETIVLLPFGRNGGDEILKIEITPTLFSVAKRIEPIKIKFDKPIPSGEISIEASKIPHNFDVVAILLADGQEIAKGICNCLIEEEKEIILQTLDSRENQSFKTKIMVDKFTRNSPRDLIRINFSFYRENQPILPNSAGINMLGEELTYRLDNANLPQNKNYELKFKVQISEAEK